MIEQEMGNIVVVVIEGDQQGRHAFRRRDIHVSAICDQRIDAVIAAVACRIQQGCQGPRPDDTGREAPAKSGLASRRTAHEA